MIGVALKGLAGRKIRALLTAFAIVIGVSMVSGTFILTDTMQKSFNGLFTASYDKTDAVVQGKEIVEGSTNGSGVTVPASLLDEVRALPEVEAAGGVVAPEEVNGADILGDDGKAVAKESIGMSYDAENARFSPLTLKSGDWPQGADQVVIDAGTAKKEHLKAGDDVVIATAGKQHTYEITGTAGYGEVDSLGFGSIAVWDLETAAKVLDREGRYDAIQIAAKYGTSPAELVDAVKPLINDKLQVKDSAKQAEEDADKLNEGMNMIRMFLLGFGGIALLVGAFVIFNTLSITVAQRTREFATLRTLGASRKQVMRSVKLEGLVHRPGRLGDRARRRLPDRQGHDRAVQRHGRRPARRADGVRRRARSSCRSCWARASRCWRASCPPAARPASRRSPPCVRERPSPPRGWARTRTSSASA